MIAVRHRKRAYGRAGRRIILAGIAAAVGLVAAAYLLRFRTSAAPSAPQSILYATVRLDAPFDPSFAGEMIAARAGLFEHEGLSVELKPGSAETDAVRQVSDDNQTIGNSYWDLDTSGISDPSQGAGSPANDPGITGLTSAQLQSGLPSGFDPAVWARSPRINNGFPYLINNPPPKK